jgi:hypothetical protein
VQRGDGGKAATLRDRPRHGDSNYGSGAQQHESAAGAVGEGLGDRPRSIPVEVFETSVDLTSLVCVGQGSPDLAALGPLPLNFVVFNMQFSRSIYVDPMQLARLARPHKSIGLPSQPQRQQVVLSARGVPLADALVDGVTPAGSAAAPDPQAREAVVVMGQNVGSDAVMEEGGGGPCSGVDTEDSHGNAVALERESEVRTRMCQILRYVGSDTLVRLLTSTRQLRQIRSKCAALENVSVLSVPCLYFQLVCMRLCLSCQVFQQ